MTRADGGGLDDRGGFMRSWLIRFFMTQPFNPFAIYLESGHELRVMTPESLIFEPGVLVASVYHDADHFEVFPVDRIVSLRMIAKSTRRA